MPEVVVGSVAGELTRLGGWLDDFSGAGTVSVHARIPQKKLAGFRTWLSTNSGGAAQLEVEAES
jgi:hypothetical protein